MRSSVVSSKTSQNPATGDDLDRIRNIILGSDLKVFDERLQAYAQAIEKNRSYFKKRIESIEEAAHVREEKRIQQENALVSELNGRLDSLQKELASLRADFNSLQETTTENLDQAMASLHQDWEEKWKTVQASMAANQEKTGKQLEETKKHRAQTDKSLSAIEAEFKKTLAAFKASQEKAMSQKLMARLEKVTTKISSHHKKQAAQTRAFQKQMVRALGHLKREKLSRAALGDLFLALSRRITAEPSAETTASSKPKQDPSSPS